MARPKKVGLDYFPVDVSWDQKMQAFDMLCKNDGIAFIVYFWQEAYKTDSGEVDLSGLFGELMANKCRITTEQLQKILSTAKEIELLYQTESGLWTSNGIKKRIGAVSQERSAAILRQEEKKVNKSKVKDCPAYSANNDSYSPNIPKSPPDSPRESLEEKRREEIYSGVVKEIIAYLNEKAHTHFRSDTEGHISARLSEGFTIDDFKNVIDKKIHQWLTDEKMRKFIRPITLFAPSHFENYLNEPEKPVTNYTWKPQ